MNSMKAKLGTIYVAVIAIVSVVTLIYVYTVPIDTMYKTRDGVPHFSPPIVNPDTGETIDLGRLIRHYKGD